MDRKRKKPTKMQKKTDKEIFRKIKAKNIKKIMIIGKK
jgi:hypothetical protein